MVSSDGARGRVPTTDTTPKVGFKPDHPAGGRWVADGSGRIGSQRNIGVADGHDHSRSAR
jgi:hypothetical protein